MRMHNLSLIALAGATALAHSSAIAHSLEQAQGTTVSIGFTGLDGTGIDPAMAASGRSNMKATDAHDNSGGSGHLASASMGNDFTGGGAGITGDDGPSSRIDTVVLGAGDDGHAASQLS